MSTQEAHYYEEWASRTEDIVMYEHMARAHYIVIKLNINYLVDI